MIGRERACDGGVGSVACDEDLAVVVKRWLYMRGEHYYYMYTLRPRKDDH
jgi:hypothetical protein